MGATPTSKEKFIKIRRTLLGVVALALFAGSIAVTGVFLQGGLEGGIPVNAVFSTEGVGQQLPEGGDVKVRGVLVGRIAQVQLGLDGRAIVELRLDSEHELPSDSRAEIRSKTVFGQKWVELIPSNTSVAPAFAEDDVIPDSRTKEPLELERALQLGHDLLDAIPNEELAEILETLADGFGGNEAAAREAMDRGLVALRAVNSTDELDTSLRQLREFSEFLADNDTELLSFMESLDEANRALVGAAPEFKQSLRTTPKFFDRFREFQEDIEPQLGRLIEDGATLLDLIDSDKLTDLFVQLEPFTTVWNSGLRQPCGGLYEDDMTCWQLYAPPGLESRGLYEDGESPLENDPSDPGASFDRPSPSVAALMKALRKADGRRVPRGLAELLIAPVAEELPELQGGRSGS